MTESSLRACQEWLRSDKVTERKQGAEQLESLLNNSRFLNLLDNNSDKPENDLVLVWDDIFRAVCAFMEKEAAKERKEEVRGKILKRPPVKLGSKLAQLVLKKSCRKNKSRVSSSEIINYFVRGLEDPFLKRLHGNALCQTLSLIILPHRVFWESFSAKDWKRICKLLVNLYESPPPAVQRSTVAHLLCAIIEKGSLQSNLASFLSEECDSFVKIITLGLEETPLLQGDAVCLLLSFSKAIGPSYRATLCHIGSHITPLLLGLWDDKQPQRQERLVEFLQIQMTAHFPHGVATAEGSKLDVEPLYLLLKDHLLNKARTPKKESQDLFVLYADILYQMLSTKSSVTLLETRSLDFWFDFVENSPSESSPWMETTRYLCERHQDLVHQLSLPRLLNMGNESKWNSTSVLRLLNLYVTLRQCQPAEFDLVWNLALRLPGPSEHPLLHLLTQIVAKHGVSREKAFTFLESLLRSVSQPKQAHLLYVAALLPHYKLPDTFSPDLQFSALNVPSSTKDTAVCPQISERFAPSVTVMDWVLKSADPDLWKLVATVLCVLASKNPEIPLQNSLNAEGQLQIPGTSFEYIFADMTFQSIPKSQAETNIPTSLQMSEPLVGYMCHRLIDMLIDFETSLAAVSKSDGEMIALCSKIFNCISVASYLVQRFGSLALNVIDCVRKLLTKLSASLERLFSRSPPNSLVLARVMALLADYHPHVYQPLHSSIKDGLKDVLVCQLSLIETSQIQACASFDDDLEDTVMKTTPQTQHDGGGILDPNALSSTERLVYECVRVLSSYNEPETAEVVIEFGDAVLSRNHLSIIPVLHIAFTYASCAGNDIRNKILDWVWQLGREHGRNADVAVSLLRILRKMCPGIQYCPPRFRDVLQFWYETSLEQNAGTSVLEGFWELLSIIARVDPKGEIFSRSNGKSMACSLIDGLSAQQLPYMSWRVAGFIGNLFSHASSFQDDLQNFENIWKHFSSSDDSDVHRSHVTFRVLETVIVVCPGLQEKCLFLTFWAAYRLNLLPDDFRRILRHIAKELDVCLQEYLALHMGSLVQSWLLTSLPLPDFPFRVCGFETFTAFLSRYRLVVVPEVIFYQPDHLPVIADILQVPVRQLLTESYGGIMVRLLPYFSNMTIGELAKFPRVKAVLTMHFPGREFFVLLPTTLPTILSELIGLTMGPMLLEKWTGSKAYSPPQSFHLDEKLFRQALENLKLRLEQESYLGVLYYLSTHRPMGLHELLVSFFTRVVQATRPCEKQIACANLGLGLEYVISALLDNQLKYPEYVVRFVLHHSCNLLKTDSQIVLSVLRILQATLQLLLSKPHVLVPHLPFLIARLTSMVYDSKTEQKNLVLEILRTLVITNGELLHSALTNVSPFPSNELEFVELNNALDHLRGNRENAMNNEMELFLSVLDSGFVSLESLRHLTRQLCSWQSELASCLQNSSEFLRLLHRLVYGLLKLASHKDQRIVEEAAKALGELGPIDLASLVLKRDELVQASRSPMEVLAHNEDDFDLNLQVVTQLVTLLFVDDLEESLLAGNVLHQVLSSKQGAKFFLEAVRQKWDVLPCIEPFAQGMKESLQFDQVQDVENPGLSWDLLWDVTNCNFQEWITKLTLFLIQRFPNENNYYRILAPICQRNVSVCEVILPRVIHTLLALRPTVYRPLFSLQFNRCFAYCASKVEGCETHVNALLNVVRFLRTKTPPGDWPVPLLTKTPWDSNLWLTLHYIDVAKAALQVSQPFMSILCAELQLDDITPVWKNPEAFPRPVDSMEVNGHLFESYAALGDTDGVQGFRSSRCHTAPGRIQLYELTRLYDRAWLTADALASADPEKYTVNLLSTLAKVGWSPTVSHAVEQYYRETGILTPSLRAMQYECAWRLGQWNLSPLAVNLDDKSSTAITTEQLQPLLYSLAKSIKDDDSLLGSLLVSKARQVIMKGIGVANVDCTRNVYPALTQLRLVQELDSVNEWKKLGSACAQTITPKRWKAAWEESNQDAEFVEPILAARCMVSKILYEQKKVGPEFFLEVIVDNLRQARKTAYIQPVNRYLELVETMHLPLDSTFGVPLRLEEARIAKLKNCGTEAIAYIKHLARVMENQCPHHALYPLVLQLQGDWLHEMGMEKPRAILDNCFRVAYQKAQGISKDEALKSCLALAKYADRCLLAAEEHMASEAFQTQTKLLAQRKADFAKVPQANLNTKNARYLKDTLAQDELELKRWQEDSAVYLKTTVENYIAGLTQVNQSEEQQQAVSRLVSLLLHNRTNEQIVRLYYNAVDALPTHSFIQVFPQLAARLVTPQSKSKSYHPLFAKFIQEFLERCTRQHPHHTLPVLLAQQFSYKDRVFTDGAEAKPVQEEDRIKSARLMLSKLRLVPTLSSLIEKMEHLYLVLIKIANDLPESRYRQQQFDPESRLMKIRHCEEIALPTSNLPISLDGKYRDFIGICKFERRFELVGGINVPKRIFCQGTDGKHYSILVKGNDDLRQDSVMQQVFRTVNRCLQSSGEMRKKNLRIRTYNVVPLSHRSGLIEWCEDTVPFANYLIGSDGRGGAHEQYYPEDFSVSKCIQIMDEISRQADWNVKTEKFLHLCDNFHPVFRHFFLENYVSPVEWFEKRLAYTRSVAAASMAGYIVGLGDRHSQNILIDKKTAEVIHIDLGIAFDQGMLLNTPETVPFRLTRDVVDGMAVGAVSGAFIKYCEATMEVLQQHRDSILTLIEVLIYDPLYVWRIAKQNSTSCSRDKEEEVNASAQRVLLRLQEKLQCIENETSLSVAGLVGVLVQKARDPQLLVRIYKGWKPFL